MFLKYSKKLIMKDFVKVNMWSQPAFYMLLIIDVFYTEDIEQEQTRGFQLNEKPWQTGPVRICYS